jgi:hypothetical protein
MYKAYLTSALDEGELNVGAAVSPAEEPLELIRKEAKWPQETAFTPWRTDDFLDGNGNPKPCLSSP